MAASDEGLKGDGVALVPHYVLQVANGMIAGASRLYQRTIGLGINEARIVALLGHAPDLTQTGVADLLAMNKSIVSRSLQALVRSGDVTAEGTPRTMRFRLTERGWRHHEIVIRLSAHRHQLLLEGLDKPEQEQLVSMLKRMLANLPRVNAFDPDQE